MKHVDFFEKMIIPGKVVILHFYGIKVFRIRQSVYSRFPLNLALTFALTKILQFLIISTFYPEP